MDWPAVADGLPTTDPYIYIYIMFNTIIIIVSSSSSSSSSSSKVLLLLVVLALVFAPAVADGLPTADLAPLPRRPEVDPQVVRRPGTILVIDIVNIIIIVIVINIIIIMLLYV